MPEIEKRAPLAPLVGVGLAISLVACSATPPQASTPNASAVAPSANIAGPSASARTPTASPASSPKPALVGEWKGTHDCSVIVEVLTANGFADFVNEEVVGEELIPGVTDPAKLRDPKHPCLDAVSEPHWHFFRADGAFGSLDKNRQRVDDGQYTIVDAHRFLIGDVPFDYTVTGDSLVMRPAALGTSCKHGEWCQNLWMLMVSLPGQTWTRTG